MRHARPISEITNRKVLIHAPTKGATNQYVPLHFLHRFNTRTREGCDRSQFLQCPALRKVLIHAPARGATAQLKGFYSNQYVLIHAPARGATAKSYKIGNNFTVLVRKFVQIFDILILNISIFLEKQEQYFFIFAVRISRDSCVASDLH